MAGHLHNVLTESNNLNIVQSSSQKFYINKSISSIKSQLFFTLSRFFKPHDFIFLFYRISGEKDFLLVLFFPPALRKKS